MPDPPEVGYCRAVLIFRDLIHRGDLFSKMDEHPAAKSKLAKRLFTLYTLRPEYTNACFEQSTGIDPKRFSTEDILLIDELRVHEHHRRKGLGSAVVDRILSIIETMQMGDRHVYPVAAPGPLHPAYASENTNAQKQTVAVEFWTDVGFDRIGSSDWYAAPPIYYSESFPSTIDETQASATTVETCGPEPKREHQDIPQEHGTDHSSHPTSSQNRKRMRVTENASNRKRKENLPKEATSILKSWFQAHRTSPYPTETEKLNLCSDTGLTLIQVSNWFINARRRAPQKL